MQRSHSIYPLDIKNLLYKSDIKDAPTDDKYLIADANDKVNIKHYSESASKGQADRPLKENPYTCSDGYDKDKGNKLIGKTSKPSATIKLCRLGIYYLDICLLSANGKNTRIESYKIIFSNENLKMIQSSPSITTGSGVGELVATVNQAGHVKITASKSKLRTYYLRYSWRKTLALPN